MEGSVGDVYAQNFVWFNTSIDSFISEPQSKKKFPHYSESGKIFEYGGKQTSMRLLNFTQLDYSEGWNKIEIVVNEDSAIFYVNDKLATKIWNIRYVPYNKHVQNKPLIKGRIGIQAEATEIIFKNIELKLNSN